MRALKIVLMAALAIIALAAVAGGPALNGALRVATGYSAKQLCSGVFVAGLPAEFIMERDIHPTLSILGPARGALEANVDLDGGFAEASLLWSSARASHRPGRGCSLGAQASGDPSQAPIAAVGASPGVASELEDAFDKAFTLELDRRLQAAGSPRLQVGMAASDVEPAGHTIDRRSGEELRARVDGLRDGVGQG